VAAAVDDLELVAHAAWWERTWLGLWGEGRWWSECRGNTTNYLKKKGVR
jgi:hypothetical protein